MATKSRLSFWQIWNMSFGFFGIQFGFALQNANVSRIFETLGAEIDDIPILWIAAPVTGLLVQPIIGHMSDKTWTKLGRRRPYFLVGAILASLALILMPNSPVLWVAAGTLWIMDASINISMEPFRAFVGDLLPKEQRTAGFAMQSFFIGAGAVIASALPWLMTNWFGISNTAPEGQIAPSVKWSFYIGALIFVLAILVTVLSTKEYSPEEMKAFEESEADKGDLEIEKPKSRKLRVGLILLVLGAVFTLVLSRLDVQKEIYILSFGLMGVGVVELFAWVLEQSKQDNGFISIIFDLNHMPKTMWQLSFVQFFSWFALFSMWIYATPAVTSHIIGNTDTTSQAYQDGGDWVGILFGAYNLFAAIFAFLLVRLSKSIGNKKTHMLSLLVGGISFISIYFFTDINALVLPFIGIGLVWASILSMPYAILTGAIPSNKMGVYMGIFNFFIVIPQICAASILGFIVKDIFDGESIYAFVIGGFSFIVAAVMMLFVHDPEGE